MTVIQNTEQLVLITTKHARAMKMNNQRSIQKVRVCDIMTDEAEAQFKVTLNCVE